MKKLILCISFLSAAVLGCNSKMPAHSLASTPQTFDAHRELVASGNDFYSYQFTTGDCTTGRHEFTDHAELCRALIDDAYNHWCAWRERHDKFNDECR